MAVKMRKVVIASDSFKGCLSSAEVARAAGMGVLDVCPGCEVVSLAVADGGEGTVDALAATLGARIRRVEVSGPLGRRVIAEYAIAPDGTAVIEMAKASGLTLLSPDERNPLAATTYGTGELVADALDKGCRRFLICIGGSATNDAGTGALEALGYVFTDAEGRRLKGCGESLGKIADVDTTGADPRLKESHFIVACDVDSPFCGPEGAAYVYAPQKGATPELVATLDEGMRSFSRIIYKVMGMDVTDIAGAGAAGGLGGALKAFLNAEMSPGAAMVLDAVGFDEAIKGADLVITGEGRMDAQTITGKLPYTVAQRASARGVPVIAICGRSEVDALRYFKTICQVTPSDMPLAEALRPDTASLNIRTAIAKTIKKG